MPRRSTGPPARAPSPALVVAPGALGNLVTLVLRHLRLETIVVSDVSAAAVPLRDEPIIVIVDMTLARASTLLKGALEERPASIAIVDNDRGSTSFEAFAHGADQVVRLPFTPDELAVRAAALLRRLGHRISFARAEALDGLELNLDEHVHAGSRTIDLSPAANSLLYVLAANAGRTVTNAEMRRLVWGFDRDSPDTVIASSVEKLAKKLSEHPTKHFVVKRRADGAALGPYEDS